MAETLSRLPDEALVSLRSEPLLASRLASGGTLERTLADRSWAKEWLDAAGSSVRETLEWIVGRYGAMPFEAEKLEREMRHATRWTGAEIRVALIRLRKSGIVFAVRKLWGETLLYVPTDTAVMWKRLLLPVRSAPLETGEERNVRKPEADYRPPLSIQLLAVWFDIRKTGLPLTSKGLPHKTAAARIAGSLRFAASELGAIAFALPNAEGCPPPLSLAIDLGLLTGVLVREPSAIAAAPDPQCPSEWADLLPEQFDRLLLGQIIDRFASQQPLLFGAAVAISQLVPLRWHVEREARAGLPEEASADFAAWIRLLEAFGWIERGEWRSESVLRWKIDLGFAEEDGEPIKRASAEKAFVLPDLEIMVPPGVPVGPRWLLEEIADRKAVDVVSTYALTKEACVAAGRRGYDPESLLAALERICEGELPGNVRLVVRDWFRTIGKASVESAVLLRIGEEKLTALIERDPRAQSMLAEKIGPRVYRILPERADDVGRWIAEFGYSTDRAADSSALPAGKKETAGDLRAKAPAAGTAAKPAEAAIGGGSGGGWALRRHELGYYEQDPLLPDETELFPGVDGIPASWLSKPAAYHPSTRRKLIERAIAWRTALRIGSGQAGRIFVPETLDGDEGDWRVSGTVRPDGPFGASDSPGTEGKLTLTADEFGEMMIVLPGKP